jgi:beta-alanine--pyruvate transaminase
LRHPLNIEKNAFSQGILLHGAEMEDELEQRLLVLHDPSTVAAAISDFL